MSVKTVIDLNNDDLDIFDPENLIRSYLLTKKPLGPSYIYLKSFKLKSRMANKTKYLVEISDK